MKNLIKILLLTVLAFTFSYSSAFATNWTIEVNGNKLDTEVKEINNRTLVPLRAVGEALNLDVNYDSSNGVVTLETTNENFSSASIQLNSKTNAYTAKVTSFTENYKQYDLNISTKDNYFMNVAPVEINDRLYVPVRIICDSFGAPVEVRGNTISIGSCFTAEDNSKSKITETVAEKKPDYTYLAGNDFRYIQRQYSTAKPLRAYVISFTNMEGHLCVLTDVWYELGKNYHLVTLHDMDSGITRRDPVSEYDRLADRAYGQARIHYMDLGIEIMKQLADMPKKGTLVDTEKLKANAY